MIQSQMIAALREEAKSNPASHAVFLMFATRQRARNQVSLVGLAARMKGEGFEFPDAEYARILRFLAQLGFGKLETSSSNRVIALKDVRVTLQSIGAVAVGNKASFTGFKQRNKFVKLVADARAAAKPEVIPIKADKEPTPVNGKSLTFTVEVNSKPVTIRMPAGTTPEELANIIVRLQPAL